MTLRLASRMLLGFAAILLLVGSVIHAAAFFGSVNARLGESDLSPMLLREIRTLWLADSSTLAVVALVLLLVALRRKGPDQWLAWAVCAIPAATAALLYCFLGPTFFAAHLVLVATLAAVIGIGMGSRGELTAANDKGVHAREP